MILYPMITAILSIFLACQPLVNVDPATSTGASDTSVTTSTTPTETATQVTTTTTSSSTTVTTAVVPNVDGSDLLFDDDILPEFHITLSAASFSSLQSDPYTYVIGSLSFNDLTFNNVGIRTKGQNSWRPINEKPSLKIKLDWKINQTLYGLKELTLNAMNDDPTMMHERIAYRFYREAGIPAARATHAWVTINEEPYGLYTHIETVDRDFIRRWFKDDTGPMFEQWDVDFYDNQIACPDPDAGQPCFELEFGEDDRSGLQGIADALESGSGAAKMEAAGEHLDVPGFIRYWAAGVIVGQYDAYPYGSDDCHLFTQENGLLLYIPHGVDETFSDAGGSMSGAGGILATTCTSDTNNCYADWVDQVWAYQAVSEKVDLLGYHDFVADQVEALIDADTHHDHGSTSTVLYYQNDMRSFISTRRQQIQNQLGSP
jgi:spore coat protein CotH